MTTNSPNEPIQQELLNLLSARKGHFRLESGHHGDLWLDLDLLFLRPRLVQRFAFELASRLSQYNPAVVCGPLVGGALIAHTIASELDVEYCYAERFVLPQRATLSSVAYRIPNGPRKLVEGKRIAIVDDVINAGSAVRGTFAALRACGAEPVVIAALLVLGASAPRFFADQNVPVECITRLPSGLWLPSECPLCASQIPLEDATADGSGSRI
jgi:orotate phosphoribosyltransferase